eukprot:g18238.t1
MPASKTEKAAEKGKKGPLPPLKEKSKGLDVLIYFWDERDGPELCGWWIGPKVGGDQVMRMKDVVTGKVVAVKSSSQGLSSWSLREISALRACQHPNVVQLLDVHAVPESVHLILEFMPFDLRVLKGPFADLKPAFRQILLGLGHCHRQGYLHRDLKPQNILVDGGTLKLADFGLASRRYLWPFRCQKPLTKFVVTVWYRAPELILMDSGQCMYGQGVDIWSLGCILAEMATNRPMFPGDSEIDTLFKIFRMKGTPAATTWPGLEQMGHFSRSFPHWEETDVVPLKKWMT